MTVVSPMSKQFLLTSTPELIIIYYLTKVPNLRCHFYTLDDRLPYRLSLEQQRLLVPKTTIISVVTFSLLDSRFYTLYISMFVQYEMCTKIKQTTPREESIQLYRHRTSFYYDLVESAKK